MNMDTGKSSDNLIQLPDSTTSAVAMSNTNTNDQQLQVVSVDTVSDGSFHDEFFLENRVVEDGRTMLNDVNILNKVQPAISDILSDALLSTGVNTSDLEQHESSFELVSSTMHGYPKQQSLQNNNNNNNNTNDQVILLSSAPQQIESKDPPNDIYTLTLTDGSVVQLKVQNDQKTNDLNFLSDQQQCSNHSQESNQNDDSFDLWPISSQLNQQLQQMEQQHQTPSPPSIGEEVILPFSHSMSSHSNPTSPGACSSISHNDSSSSAACDEDTLLSMFSCMDSVTIEALKAQLVSLPDGQTDLGALLVAAKIDLTVEDIVGPPLNQVKRIMEQKGLSDWQTQLCIKIRRRKKNTVSFT